MADLLYKKLFIITFAAAITCHSAYAFESSFPFPFEFGHSSDIYLNVKTPNTKQERQDLQKANEILVQRGISKEPKEVMNYIKNNDFEKVDLVLKAGFDPNTSYNANYPIYYAVRYKRPEILKLLLDSGADIKMEVSGPLRDSIINNNYECAKLLIEYGADVNYYHGVLDEYVLYTALKKKEYGLARMMIEKGAKIDIKSYKEIKKKNLERKMGINIDWLPLLRKINVKTLVLCKIFEKFI